MTRTYQLCKASPVSSFPYQHNTDIKIYPFVCINLIKELITRFTYVIFPGRSEDFLLCFSYNSHFYFSLCYHIYAVLLILLIYSLHIEIITHLFYRLTQLFFIVVCPRSGLGHYNPLYNDMFRPLYLAIIRFLHELRQWLCNITIV